jgi:hypothetical protein
VFVPEGHLLGVENTVLVRVFKTMLYEVFLSRIKRIYY